MVTPTITCVFLKHMFRHPYVGIIQIRFSVEGHTFLSACTTSSRFYLFLGIVPLFNSNCKIFLKKKLRQCRSFFKGIGKNVSERTN